MLLHVISQKEQFVVRKSIDEECVCGALSQWVPCSKAYLNVLGKETKISECLHLYSNYVVEMSSNKGGHCDQGKIAILLHIPSQKDFDEWVPLYALLGLLTDTMLPVIYNLLSDEDMESIGWKVITISRE
eukprot:3192553-Ditylum_brightwellii.AAC.1